MRGPFSNARTHSPASTERAHSACLRRGSAKTAGDLSPLSSPPVSLWRQTPSSCRALQSREYRRSLALAAALAGAPFGPVRRVEVLPSAGGAEDEAAAVAEAADGDSEALGRGAAGRGSPTPSGPPSGATVSGADCATGSADAPLAGVAFARETETAPHAASAIATTADAAASARSFRGGGFELGA